MKTTYLIKTERVGIRNWQESDIEPMTALNQDDEVMEFFPMRPTLEETAKFIHRMQGEFTNRGYCYFAADRLDTGEFIGFIGLLYQNYDVDFCPMTDIGWRLKKDAWGFGFATEGAKACLDYAFKELKLTEIYSTCTTLNHRSENVMKKIGMTKVKHFVHPKISHDERLRDSVLYKILRP